MKYANSQPGRGPGNRRSSRVALSPYMIEDLAITASELQRMLSADRQVVASR